MMRKLMKMSRVSINNSASKKRLAELLLILYKTTETLLINLKSQIFYYNFSMGDSIFA